MLGHIEMFLKVAAFKNNLVELISGYAVCYILFTVSKNWDFICKE